MCVCLCVCVYVWRSLCVCTADGWLHPFDLAACLSVLACVTFCVHAGLLGAVVGSISSAIDGCIDASVHSSNSTGTRRDEHLSHILVYYFLVWATEATDERGTDILWITELAHT
mmetsp:Transcript_45059/g.111919  ORF Transcript_45059/g.111919 Transcript_45059/m.111919 type:complete len:114 (-) Transcript_45059:42-383(-)